MPTRARSTTHLLRIRAQIEGSLFTFDAGGFLDGPDDIVQLTSRAERAALVNLFARQMRHEYEKAILKPVRHRTPRRTGDLRRSMRVKRGQGRGVLIDVYALQYGLSPNVISNRQRGVHRGLIRREGNGRLQKAVDNAFIRAFISAINQ